MAKHGTGWLLLCLLSLLVVRLVRGANDYDCSVNKNCLSCVRDPGHSDVDDGATECHWCVTKLEEPWTNFDGECRNDQCFGINVRTRIHIADECPISSCSLNSNCEDCLDDRQPFTDCQWCFASGKCVDWWGYDEESTDGPCSDPRPVRVTYEDNRRRCPPRGHRLNAEMLFGVLGLLTMILLFPCYFCRWCLQPCISCNDRWLWLWKRSMFKGKDEFGQGATFAQQEKVLEVMRTSKKEAGRFEVD